MQIQLDRQEYLAERAEMEEEELLTDSSFHATHVPKLIAFKIEDNMVYILIVELKLSYLYLLMISLIIKTNQCNENCPLWI